MEFIVSVSVSIVIGVVPGADIDEEVDGVVEEALFDSEVILKKLFAPESSEKR